MKSRIQDPFFLKEDMPLEAKEEDFTDLVTNGRLQISFKERNLPDFGAYAANNGTISYQNINLYIFICFTSLHQRLKFKQIQIKQKVIRTVS